ncbi:MAG TPA: ABC transporter permease [Lacunisphaera sp.]|jgi:putative ABC transport system permease protein
MNHLRHSFRSLRKTPAFTAVAVLIVALGIGAATAMFSTVNALVLRPIALPEPDRLVAIYETNLTRNITTFSVSIPNYYDWKDRAKSWDSIAALNWRPMNLTGRGEPESIPCKAVTANFFPTLGIPLALGRNFTDEEDRPGGANVAIITDSFWRGHFGRATNVIGQTMLFDGRPYSIIGVLGPGQPLLDDLEVAVPLAVDPAKERRTNHEMEIYGRLKHGVSLEQAEAELKSIAGQIWSEHPDMDHGWSVRLAPLAREIVGDGIRTGLYVLLGSVGLLLLIACANLSNLLLVRASARAHEMAIRTALGANRARLIWQIMSESMTVTLTGGLLGVLLSLWAVDAMHSLPLPRAAEISLDLRVLTVACAATLLAGIFSALGPALKASQTRPQEALKGRSPRSAHRSRLRDTMVVLQLAISLTLLVGATLLGRSFLHLLRVNPGFNSDNVLTVSLRPKDDEQAAKFYERLTERISTLPGVGSVGVISSLPLTEGNTSNNLFPVGPSGLSAGVSIQSSWRLIDGGYFGAMQIPLLRGRTFTGITPEEATRSVVLSASLARMLFGANDPVGRQVTSLRPDGERLTVLGVVGDVRSQKLGVAAVPTFYWSMHRFIYGPMHLVVRLAPTKPGQDGTIGDPASLLSAIRSTVKELDPTVPLFQVRTLEQIRATSLEQERLVLSLLGGFTTVALLLCALGTYGVIAFSTQQRTQEFGIRVAIGAQGSDILRLVIGQGARLVTIGIILGLAAALTFSRILAALLYKTETTDPLSYAVAAAVLALVALSAALIPARRATKVDPVVALRAE